MAHSIPNVDAETGFRMKFLDGSPAPEDYLNRVSGMISSAATAEQQVFIDDLESYANEHRDDPDPTPRTSMTARPTHATRQELADIMLAEKTGWTSIIHTSDRLWGHHDAHDGLTPIPRPCHDWAACGPLLALYDLSLDTSRIGKVVVSWRHKDGQRHDIVAEYADVATKEVTMRYAIVLAAYERTKAVPYTEVIERPNVEQYIAAIHSGN